MTKSKDHKITSGKSLHKQQQQAATKTNSKDGEGGSKSARVSTVY